MKQTPTLVKGSFWILLSGILTKLIGFLYTVIIARLLPPEDVGIFYLVISILGILYVFTDLGLYSAAGRYIPYFYGRKEFGKLRELVKLCYVGGGVLTFIFSIGVFFLAGNIAEIVGEPVIKPIIEMLAIWLFLREMDDISRGILNGRKRIKESQGILFVLQNFLKLIITLIAFYLIGFNVEALSIGFLLSFLLIIPLGIYFVVKEMNNWKKEETCLGWMGKWKLGKEVVSFGIVATAIEIFTIILYNTDRIMLGHLIEESLEEIAVYSMAIGLGNLVLIFPGALIGIFCPVIAELYGKKDMKEMKRTTDISMKWVIMLMMPIFLMMALFSGSLLEILYGTLYERGGLVLVLFVCGLFVKTLFVLPGSVLIAMRKLSVEIKAVVAAGIVNIVLNILLIPIWGINGAALASALSFITLSMIIWYYSKKIFDFKFPKRIYKPLIAGLIGLIILFLLKGQILFFIDNYISQIQIGQSEGQLADEIAQKLVKLGIFGVIFGISCIIYFLLLLMLRTFGEDELEILEAGLKRAGIPKKYMKLTRTILEGKYLGSH